MDIKSNKGLTLVEMVISVTLLSLIILTTLAVLNFGQKTFVSTNNSGILQSSAQNALLSISSLIRESSNINVSLSNDSINLEDKNQRIIIFEKNINLVDSTSGNLIRTLAQNVEHAVFTGIGLNGVTVDINFITTTGNYETKMTVYTRSA